MQTLTQRKSPLTQQQREILATVINQCAEFNVRCSDIWTIRLDETVNVLWVHLYDGRQLPFDRNQFKAAVAKVKAEIAPQPQSAGMPIPQGLVHNPQWARQSTYLSRNWRNKTNDQSTMLDLCWGRLSRWNPQG